MSFAVPATACGFAHERKGDWRSHPEALAGALQCDLNVADAIDAVSRDPTERHVRGNGALDLASAMAGFVAKRVASGMPRRDLPLSFSSS